MADKETQIKTLLYGDPYAFACEILGVDNMMNQRYADVFTVTEAEVYAYTLTHGLPPSQSKQLEGFHYYQEDGKWYTYFRERGQVFDEQVFSDDELGRKYIVRTLLKLRGTGLY